MPNNHPDLGLVAMIDRPSTAIALRDVLLGLEYRRGPDRRKILRSNLTPDRLAHSYTRFQYGLALVRSTDSGDSLRLHVEEITAGLTDEAAREEIKRILTETPGTDAYMIRKGALTFEALKIIRESQGVEVSQGSVGAINTMIEEYFPERALILAPIEGNQPRL